MQNLCEAVSGNLFDRDSQERWKKNKYCPVPVGYEVALLTFLVMSNLL